MSDTLAALQKALSPKTGMQRIPFPLESYVHPSLPLSAKRLLNYYSEAEPPDARTPAALIPTPGLTNLVTVGTGPIHAINTDFIGWWYVASGTHFWRGRLFTTGWLWEDLGDVGSSEVVWGLNSGVQPVTIAVNSDGAMICVPPNAFFANHTEPAAHQLGGTFPGEATSVVALNGYFVFTSQVNGSQFFISRLHDPTDYDALDFANSDAFPQAGLLTVKVLRGQLWFGSVSGWEVWYDSGDADFPFRPQPGAVIPYGLASPQCVAFGDGSIWWASIDGLAFRSDGYKAQRISTHAIEEILRLTGGPAMQSFCLLHGGHTFYVMQFADRTLVYDSATKTWHDRASSFAGDGRWRANSAQTTPDGQGVVGDILTGQIFRSDPSVATEAGSAVLRQITSPPIYAATRRAFCARLEVEMGTGGDPTDNLTLDWSDDGGHSYSGGPRALSAGTSPRKRVFTTRLGSFRQRAFRLSTTGKPVLYAIDADITPGAT